ncbi:MAG: hypothetical protein D8M58_11040 [Calditrichaeota bacterium]|nr:MAG: hypothetical protein DWQ03_10415 [Calditrichota bacterium]MBL1205928.1 hypothetical protein [Calditrichota bacterium]NOG45756.1 hypothetical protein [Calditrichota bacterium]
MKKHSLISILLFSMFLILACSDDSTSPIEDDDDGLPTGTLGTVTDIDGNEYQTIKIGKQWWMTENLRVTRYRNADSIRHVPDDNEWTTLTEGGYSIYDHHGANIITYGLLYNGYAAQDSRNIAPDGWRVATDDDWKELEVFLGIPESELNDNQWRGTNEGDKIKESGTLHWVAPNANATNEYGFTAQPNGFRSSLNANFIGLAHQAYFWTSSVYNNGSDIYGWARGLHRDHTEISRVYYNNNNGFGVRCIKD